MASKKREEKILEVIRKNNGISKSAVFKEIGGNKKDTFGTIDMFESNGLVHVDRTKREHRLSVDYDVQGTEGIIKDLKTMREIFNYYYYLIFEIFKQKRKLTQKDKNEIYEITVKAILPLLKFAPSLILFGINSVYGSKMNKETNKSWIHSCRMISKIMRTVEQLDGEIKDKVMTRLFVETGNYHKID